MLVRDALKILEQKAPSQLAEEWDNVGLLAGRDNWPCTVVLTGVDLTKELVEEAVRVKAGLIVTHHPAIFRGIKALTGKHAASLEALLLDCIEHRIAVAACHTNFDQAALEVVRAVADGLKITPTGRLVTDTSFLKLTTFVPLAHVAEVRAAVFAAGAGRIGAYDECSFEIEGLGGYRPGDLARPFKGEIGLREAASEVRFECILPAGLRAAVLQALRQSHPYEEVAYDFHHTDVDLPKKGVWSGIGYGLWGKLDPAVPFNEFVERVQALFSLDAVRVTGAERPIKKAAFCAGKGSSFVKRCVSLGVDVYVVGEVDYHTALMAERGGVSVIEVGHTESEKFFAPTLAAWLGEAGFKTLSLNHRAQRTMSRTT